MDSMFEKALSKVGLDLCVISVMLWWFITAEVCVFFAV